MNNTATSNITKEYIKHKCNEKFNTSNNKETVDNDFDSICCISQHNDQLRTFAINQRIDRDIENFYPGSNWGFINVNKLKVKWKTCPTQTQIKGKKYSVFGQDSVRHLQQGSFHLYIFATNIPNLAVCIAPAMIKFDIEEIKSIFKEYTVVSGPVAVEHVDFKVTNSLDTDTYDFKVGETQLNCRLALDHYHVTLDRHGIYINKQSRNKFINSKEVEIKHYVQCPYILWIENLENNVIFQSICA
jgi:hypothetical protein